MTPISFRQLSRNKALRERWLFKGEQITLKVKAPDGKRLHAFLPRPLLEEEVKPTAHKIDLSKYIGAWGKEKKPLTAKQLRDEVKNAWLSCD